MRLWKARRDPVVQWLFAAIAAASASLYVAATIAKFPFWGRHLAPLLPFVMALVAVAVSSHTASVGLIRRYCLPSLLAVSFLASSLMLRFSASYRKDDYRTAARLALSTLAAGKTVWWFADAEECAVYYGLTPDKATAPGAHLIFGSNPTAEQMAAWPPPDVLFLSKPDIYDTLRVIPPYAEKFQFRPIRRLAAFTILTKPDFLLERILKEQ